MPATKPALPSVSNPSPLPVDVFMHRLAERGLSLTLDTNGQSLQLHGPKEARTDRIRAYVRAAKTDLINHLLSLEHDRLKERDVAKATRRAVLVEEFGEDLVAEGEGVELDLLRQRDAAVSAGYDDHGDNLHAAYLAAVNGRMPKVKVVLSPGRETTDPGFLLLQLVDSGRRLRKKYGPVWREVSAESERIASDIEAIASWYISPERAG